MSARVKKQEPEIEEPRAALHSSRKKTEYICCKCGSALTDENYRQHGGLTCLDCESKEFEELEKSNGTCLGLFLACSRFDVPLYPLLITDNNGSLKEEFDKSENKWLEYLDILDREEKLIVDGEIATFADGETRLLYIFGKEFDKTDFSTHVRFEREKLKNHVGTTEQRERWGTRPLWQNLPMTNEIYSELDRMFFARLSRYKGFNVDEQLEDTIKKWTTLSLVQDHLRSLGDAAGYDKVQKSIDSMLAAEQLRKKDEKPLEDMRIDALVLALENAGLMENGELLNYDELLDAIIERFPKEKKYNYSIDVADQVLLDIINSMRANADVMQLIDLPEEYKLVDEHGEFEPEETEQEKEAKRYLGLTKIHSEPKKNNKPKRSVKKNA